MFILRSVRSFAVSAAIGALFCAISAPSAFGANIVFITADENGNGTIQSGGSTGILPFGFAVDPGPGGLASAANYGMFNPPGLVAGDILLLESNESTSDVIRFDATVGGGSFFVYSLLGSGTLADTGLPTATETNSLSLSEVSLPGLGFGAVYTPTAGQPGFVAGSLYPVTYTFISDAVPEPSTSGLLLAGLSVMAISISLNRRRT